MKPSGAVVSIIHTEGVRRAVFAGASRFENPTVSADRNSGVDQIWSASPEALRNHLRIAVPYLVSPTFQSRATELEKSFLAPIFRLMESEHPVLSPVEYFELCLCVQWATAGGYLPTDLDSQLRRTLWHSGLTHAELDSMGELVLEAYRWPTDSLSHRSVQSSLSGQVVSAHQGEWLGVACAAYASLRRSNPARAAEILERVQFEVTRQAKVYLEFKRVRDGVGLLKAATLIAQNLGDLDRVIEAWSLSEDAEDPLVQFAYRATHESGSRALRFSGALAEAGRLHRTYMVLENHRHFPLRTPRALRRSTDFLLPIGPFFDAWGETIATHSELRPNDIAEVVTALVTGWEKLKGPEGKTVTYAYARAIAGIVHRYPGGMDALKGILPVAVERSLKTGLFHSLMTVSRERFEEQWSQMAFTFVK